MREETLLPRDIVYDPKRLTPDNLARAFSHFDDVVRKFTGIQREWTPTDILKVGELLIKKFARYLDQNGEIHIKASQLKILIKEVIGEVFPAHVAMLMQALMEKGEADFNYESKAPTNLAEEGEVEVRVIKEEETPTVSLEGSETSDTALDLDLRTARYFLAQIHSPKGDRSYGT